MVHAAEAIDAAQWPLTEVERAELPRRYGYVDQPPSGTIKAPALTRSSAYCAAGASGLAGSGNLPPALSTMCTTGAHPRIS